MANPLLEALCFDYMSVTYTHAQANSIKAYSLLINPLVHKTYASPGSRFSDEYAPLTNYIPSSITQLSSGILFRTHCSRYPTKLTSAKPFLTSGKNISTNLSSICNALPPPPNNYTTAHRGRFPVKVNPIGDSKIE